VASELNDYLDFIYDKQEGYVYTATREPESNSWNEKFFKWPAERVELSDYITKKGATDDIYTSPAIWKFPGKLGKNLFKSSAVAFTEYDGNALSVDEGIYEPSLKVQSSSPTCQHVYFKLDKPTDDPSELEKINEIITYGNDGDPSAWDCTQILRPPGTTNFKYEDKPQTKLIYQASTTLSRSLFKNLERPKKFDAKIDQSALPELMDVIARHAWAHDDFDFFMRDSIAGGSRSSAMMRLGHVCAEMGMSSEEAYVTLRDADDRWKKYVHRRDRDTRLLEIISKAFSTKSPKHRKYKLLSSDELFHAELDASWIVDGLLLTNSIGVVYSQPGVGKTRLSMQLAIALAGGKNRFLAWDIPKPQKVLMLSLEMDDLELQLFYKDMVSQDESRAIGSNLMFFAEGQPLDIDKASGQEVVYGLIREYKPDILVIDSLGAAVSADVSSNVEVKQFFKFVSKIRRDFGVTVWIIHHGRKPTADNKAPKGLGDMYGSVYIGAEAGTVLCLWQQGDGHYIELSVVKGRHLKDKRPLRLQNVPDSAYFQIHANTEVLDSPVFKEAKNDDGPTTI
jgi:archaellum biogenesis ATPase FlaH